MLISIAFKRYLNNTVKFPLDMVKVKNGLNALASPKSNLANKFSFIFFSIYFGYRANSFVQFIIIWPHQHRPDSIGEFVNIIDR